MAAFVYRIKDGHGRVSTGIMEGDNQFSVVNKLRQPGTIVLDVKQQRTSSALSEYLAKNKKVTRKELTIFSRQFATMINSGLPLTKCLAILFQQTTNRTFKHKIDEIQHDISGGLTLSGALTKHHDIFPDIYVSTIRAGESGGVLDDVLLKLADHLEKEDNIRAKIKGAMAYPTMALAFTFIIVGAMITFIVPVFTKIFADLGGDLPGPTKVLIMMSSIIRGYWYLLVIAMIGMVFGFKRAREVEEVRYWLDTLKLKLPGLGNLNRKAAVSKFTRTLGTLIVSGVPILGALEIVADTAGNKVIASAITRVRSSVKEGETIAKPLEASGVFPPMVTQMISVGEETGALDIMLQKIADFYDNEVEVAVESVTSLIEPALIIIMGGAIAGIMLSLYMPMFKLVSLVK